MLKKIFSCLLWVFIYSNTLNAQQFLFEDTHPITEITKLEEWLELNPKPSIERLRALIIAERTYSWNYYNKLGRHLDEIQRLSKTYKSVVGEASYNYIKAYYLLNQSSQQEKVSIYALEALKKFEQLKDTSGLIHAQSLLLIAQSNIYGNPTSNDIIFQKKYLGSIEKLIRYRNNNDDKVMKDLAYTKYLFGQESKNPKELAKTTQRALDIINKNTVMEYARYRIEKIASIACSLDGNSLKAIEIDRKIIHNLKPEQSWELGGMYYNLAYEYYYLQKNDEGINACKKSIEFFSKKNINNGNALTGPYHLYRTLAQQKGNYLLANKLADSVLKYHDITYFSENDKKLIELQEKYDFERKQRQIDQLETDKKDIENKQNLIVLALVSALGIIFIFIILITKLRKANYKLNILSEDREQFIRILAHDLRRPLHSFMGMGELMSKLLKRGDNDKILKISNSIDESGIKIMQLLDNTLYWSLIKKESVLDKPETFILLPHIQSVVYLYLALAEMKSIKILIKCNENLSVTTNSNALNLILRNLFDNATKHVSTNGQIECEVEEETDKIIIWFKDNGEGMTDEILDNIRSVLQNPKKFSPKHNNMGLGLINIGLFTKQNNIQIEVDSILGKGSTYKLIIPKV